MKLRQLLTILGIILLIGCTQEEVIKEPPIINEPQEPEPVIVKEPTEITIKLTQERTFDPEELIIKKGSTVIWLNEGNYPQLLSFHREQPFQNYGMGTIESGKSTSYVFNEPGIYYIRSKWSGKMRGIITVTA